MPALDGITFYGAVFGGALMGFGALVGAVYLGRSAERAATSEGVVAFSA